MTMMRDVATILFVLPLVALILSLPALLVMLFIYRRLSRRNDEILAALSSLWRSVESLKTELTHSVSHGPSTEPVVSDRTETPSPEAVFPTGVATENLAGLPPEVEVVSAELVSADVSNQTLGDSQPQITVQAQGEATRAEQPRSWLDASTVNTLKRMGNWFLFGQEQLRSGTSIEVAIAANWLLRIGMLTLVLGIAFFLKYSFDRGWIGPLERVLLGAVAGFGMVTAGTLLLRGRYRLTAHGLHGGGIVTLYFTVFAAAVFYSLIPPIPIGFALMTAVTVLACIISLVFGSPLSAVIGIAGGYLTPVVLPSDQVQFFALFSYLTILGLGVLGISLRKNWPPLNLLSFVGTYAVATASIVFGYTWLDFWIVIAFLTVFFVLFSTVVFLSSRLHLRANLVDVGMLWLNAIFFFALATPLTQDWLRISRTVSEWSALIPFGIAIFYLACVYVLLVRRSEDTVLFHTSLSLAAVFTAFAIPLALSKEWVTFAWAAQASVIVWLSQRLKSPLLRTLGCLLAAVTVFRFMILDVSNVEAFHSAWRGLLVPDLVAFGRRALALGGAILCLFWAAKILADQAAAESRGVTQPVDQLRVLSNILAGVATVMLFLYGTRETEAAVYAFYPGLESGAVSIFWSLFAVTLIGFGIRKSYWLVRTAGLILFAVVTYKVFIYDLGQLQAIYRIIAFLVLGVVILSGSVLYQRFRSVSREEKSPLSG